MRTILVLFGGHRLRNLRNKPQLSFRSSPEESIHDSFETVLREGPDAGIHTIFWCNTLQGVGSALDQSILQEFGHRLSGSLAHRDSIKMFDNEIASRSLPDNRVIIHDQENMGNLATIRPYSFIDPEFISEMGTIMQRKWQIRSEFAAVGEART